MPFVKLDCGILDSTIWVSRPDREVFLTALLMASPAIFAEPQQQFQVRSLERTGFEVPAGMYGFISASGPGIVARSGVEHEAGMAALERLGEPEQESRTPDFDGRRIIRVDGGYLVLNYAKYRERDYTAAARQRRARARKASHRDVTTSQRDDVTKSRVTRDITQAEAEAEAEAEKTRTAARVKDMIAERTTNYPKQSLVTRRRKDAAWEGPRVYVPQRAHTDFIGLRNHPKAEAELLAWYAEVSEQWTTGVFRDGAIEPDMFVFWRQRFGERWPAPAKAATRREPQWVLDARASRAAGDA